VEYFLDLENSCIRWPGPSSSQESIDHVEKQQTLRAQMMEADEMFQLAQKCLIYDPKERITAKQALKHNFLLGQELRVRYLRRGIDVLDD